jgi:hypothetical protein
MRAMRYLLTLLAILYAAAGPPGSSLALADEDRDHDRARAAVERGEALPLSRIVDQARRDFGGRLLEVEMDREDGRLVYEIELMAGTGRVLELLYDARTGKLLKAEGDGLERAPGGLGESQDQDEDD